MLSELRAGNRGPVEDNEMVKRRTNHSVELFSLVNSSDSGIAVAIHKEVIGFSTNAAHAAAGNG
jgi:hypothetical protein